MNQTKLLSGYGDVSSSFILCWLDPFASIQRQVVIFSSCDAWPTDLGDRVTDLSDGSDGQTSVVEMTDRPQRQGWQTSVASPSKCLCRRALV